MRPVPILLATTVLVLASVAQAGVQNGRSRSIPNGWVVQNGGEKMPLPVEQAFPMSMMTGREGKLLLRVQMPAGYYLYSEKLSFTAEGFTIRRVSAPTAIRKVDEFLGAVNIYTGVVTFVLEPSSNNAKGAVRVKFQGCAERVVCYPPTVRRFVVG